MSGMSVSQVLPKISLAVIASVIKQYLMLCCMFLVHTLGLGVGCPAY